MDASKECSSDNPPAQSLRKTHTGIIGPQRRARLYHLMLAGCATFLLLFPGCSRQESAPTTPAPKANLPMPSTLTGQAQPAEAAPPPPAGAAGIPSPVVAQPAAAEGVVAAPSGLTDVEHLNWALGVYHVAHIESPPLKDFEPLIKAKLLSGVPKAPPGKKFVLDGPTWEVRLENAK